MEIELINLGRNKVNKKLTVKNETALWREIERHIMSSDIMLWETDTKDKYSVIVGGMRAVGEIIIK